MSGYDFPCSRRWPMSPRSSPPSCSTPWPSGCRARPAAAPRGREPCLRRTAGGFGQPEHVVDGHRRRIRVDGTFLVVDRDGDGESWHDITTLEQPQPWFGLAARTPSLASSSPPPPATPMFARRRSSRGGDDRRVVPVRRHRRGVPPPTRRPPSGSVAAVARAPRPRVLDRRDQLGGSPGDAGDSGRVEPYLYVGPWSPPVGGFWNEPYAALERSAVTTVDDALEALRTRPAAS